MASCAAYTSSPFSSSSLALAPGNPNKISFSPSHLQLLSFQPKKGFRVRNSPSPLRVFCLGEPEVVTRNTWDKLVLNSKTPVLVEFSASWCGPCRVVHRVIDEIAMEYAGRLQCYVLNADNDLQVAKNYDIKAVPVVLLFKNGQKCGSVVGTMPKEFYVAAIEKLFVNN